MTPPSFVEQIKYKNCKQINDPVTGKRHYVTPDGENLPSVTTILSHTKDTTHLDQWKRRVGEQQAAQIVKEAANVGTSMHANLERFLCKKERQPGKNMVHVQAHKMADVIIEKGLVNIDEVWAVERSLYFPGLYAGTTDMIGVYRGNPAIIDFKQTNRPKKEEWVVDYKLQMVSYALAHNAVYDTDIRQGHVFMCSRDLQYQQFDLWPNEFDYYRDLWLDRVEQFYVTNAQPV